MEKLSELNKPRAFVVTGGKMYQDRAFTDKSTAERSKADRHDGAVVESLYSQEYVSALIQRAERLDSMLTESVQALKAVEQRNAELELRLAVEIEPPPVIYPGRYDCHAMHSAIRRAGFRVSGDSEHVGDVDMRDERALAAVSDKQRITELERANTSQDDHINQQLDRIDSLEKTNAGLGRRLGDAEKRLATPVRLPKYEDYNDAGAASAAISDCEIAIRAAGFNVEEDE
ncbi:hypothetical protein SM14VA4_04680 [Serratia marcescens]|nr:hypothetical protein SM14VA4_04680 [Serratia marcescens]